MPLIETLWLHIHAALSVFSERVAMIDPSLISDLGHTKNDAFPLRAYLAFRRSDDSEEVAITVDVQSDDKRTTIESDACKDDGTVLAVGPSTEFQLSWDDQSVRHALDGWVRGFEKFLSDGEEKIVAAASRLEK